MRWSDEDIDALFKEASLKQDAPIYQDVYFDEIAGLLPKEKNRKGFFGFFGTFVLLSLCSIHFFTPSVKQTKNKSKLSLNQNFNESTLNGENTLSTSENSNPDQNSSAINHQSFSNSSFDTETKNLIQNLNKQQKNKRKHTNKKDVSSKSYFNSRPDYEITDDHSGNNLALNIDPIVASSIENSNDQDRNAEENKPKEDVSLITSSLLNKFSVLETLKTATEELLASSFPTKNNNHFVNIELSTGFSESFIHNENKAQKPILATSIGANYEYRKRNFIYSAGLNYTNYQTTNLELNRSSIVYGFEINKYQQTIDYKWISMLQLPISVGKQVKNQVFSVGVSPNLILGSVVDFTKVQNGVVTEDSRIYRNTLGLKQVGFSSHIAYDLNLNKNYSFGVKLSTQLINPLDPTRFVGNINKLTFQAQISFKKYFNIK